MSRAARSPESPPDGVAAAAPARPASIAAPPSVIPASLEEVGTGWLTQMLRASGSLGDAHVEQVTAHRIGEGSGFVGDLARLELVYDRAAPGAPTTLVAKLPTLARNRDTAELGGSYEREIRFYREVADTLPIRTPRCLGAAYDRARGQRLALLLVRLLDCAPARARRLAFERARRAVASRGRRYVLLLEDLGGLVPGDQVAGCSREQAEAALRAAASLHASHWESAALRRIWWGLSFYLAPRTAQMFFRDGMVSVLREAGPAVSPRVQELMEHLREHGTRFLRSLRRLPRTLIHSDFRLDNLFFSSVGSEPPVTVCDWQTVGPGPAAYDVAYFVASALGPDATADDEDDLLHVYHDTLRATGVSAYGFDALRVDYVRGMVAVLHRMTSGIELITVEGARGAALREVGFEACFRRLDAQPADLIAAALDR